MAEANLTNTPTRVIDGNDSIVIVRNLIDIPGGRTLDTTGFTQEVIRAGHLVIQETATGEYKPMPVTGSAYAALPAGHTYAGVVKASVLTSRPFVGILVGGQVNHAAAPYPMASILTAVRAALPLIDSRQD